jgi:hypothetical protein
MNLRPYQLDTNRKLKAVPCSRCFHIIGEHLLCLDHGGESGWSAGAHRWKPKPVDLPPVEAMGNLWHPWWNFHDNIEPKVTSEATP